MIVGTAIGGIDRLEVIDTITLRYLPGGTMAEDPENVLQMWKAIDWARSEPMLMEEFEACDLTGAVREAQAAARRRAEAYCAYIAECQARGIDGSHTALKAEVAASHLRLVRDDGGEVA
jgi:hypothetical protein